MLKKILFSLIVTVGLSHGATYVFTNSSGIGSNGIVSSEGDNFVAGGAGVVAVGFFTVSDSDVMASTSGAELISNFSNFNTDGATNFSNYSGPFFSKNVFTQNAAARTVAGSAFEGQNMYVLVGNGLTLESSTEFLVLKSSILFLAADDSVLPNKTITFTTGNTEVLIGQELADVRTSDGDSSVTPGWSTVVIPEPSTALLGMLGALGLLRRRR